MPAADGRKASTASPDGRDRDSNEARVPHWQRAPLRSQVPGARLSVPNNRVSLRIDVATTALSKRGHAGSTDDTPEEAVTYRRLAAGVIERAFKDMMAPVCATGDRESAREFLAGSPMLFLWCRVAALDPHRVIAHAMTLESRRSLAPIGLERR